MYFCLNVKEGFGIKRLGLNEKSCFSLIYFLYMFWGLLKLKSWGVGGLKFNLYGL